MYLNQESKNSFRILKGGKISLIVSGLLISTTISFASPTDGVVTSGTASISQSGNTTNINQTTDKASINWNKFDIAANETVNFNQPNSSSITLNRVVGNEKSVIDGALNANGQVWILNSNGVLFGKNASVNTAGILATTAELSDTNFQNGNYDFKGNSSESVINLGLIEVSNNGSVVLAANEVVNSGTIKAIKGKVHLTAANEYTVNLNGNSLVNLIVTKGVLDAMVENSGTISANGGEIYLTTNAVNELLKGVVNNTGIIEANSLDGLMGKVEMFAHGGEVQVGGTIEAKDGFVETSGKDFTILEDATIKAGEWLIDPVDITIDATLAGTIEGALGVGDVTIKTDATIKTDSPTNTSTVTVPTLNQTSTDGNTTDGDIYVNSAITWSSANKLTLDAADSIYINADITATAGKLALYYGDSGDYNVNAKVNLSAGANFFTKKGTTTTNWNVVTTAADVQGMSKTGNTVLGKDVDASTILNWDPIDFSGKFDGLGHTISKLTINRPSEDNVGLFGASYSSATIQNIGVIDVNITGKNQVGGLVGYTTSTIENSYVTGTVEGNQQVGGLVGANFNNSTIENSYATGTVTGNISVGGLVGYTNNSTIENSYATNTVIGNSSTIGSIGGLVGANSSTIKNSYATGTVNGEYYVGGLVGSNQVSSTIENSYATGTVNGKNYVGGLVGANKYSSSSTIKNSYATGNITGENYVGGLIGNIESNSSSTITNSYASGDVEGTAYTGGLVGFDYTGTSTITNSFYDSETNTDTSMGDSATYGKTKAQITGLLTNNIWDTNIWSYHQAAGVDDSVAGYEYAKAGLPYLTNITKTADIDTSESISLTLFNSGLGIESNPYTITNWTQLQNINYASDTTLLNKYYTLSNNIDNTTSGYTNLASSTANTNLGWNPIGNSSNPFKGTFDGLGNTISDLYINRTTDYIGLFGYASGSAIQNIGLVNVDVKGYSYVGGLVGQNYSSTITNSYASGTVRGTGYYVGGLVGQNYSSTITNSYASGTVTGNSVGGLVGSNDSSTITNSYASGTVNGDYSVGGLVGTNDSSTITNSYASGTVSGTGYYVGGLIGYNDLSTITNSYATGEVTGTDNVGGLIGYNYSSTITNSYATGIVNGTTDVGGLTGKNDAAFVITNSFYDKTKNQTGMSDSTTTGITGKTTEELSYGKTFDDATWDIVADSTVTSLTPVIKYDSVNSKYYWAIAPLSLSYALSDKSKTYDGQTQSLSSLYTNVFGSDYSFITGYKFQVNNIDVTGYKDAGTYENIKVVLDGTNDFLAIASSGNPDGKYIINKKDITSITDITAANKTYDGTTNATLTTTDAKFTGIVTGDTLNVATSTGTFDTKDVGTAKTVNITGLTLGGTDKDNYNLTLNTASTSANILAVVVPTPTPTPIPPVVENKTNTTESTKRIQAANLIASSITRNLGANPKLGLENKSSIDEESEDENSNSNTDDNKVALYKGSIIKLSTPGINLPAGL